MAEYQDPRLPKTFWSKTTLDGTGCWVWTRAKTHGYGAYWDAVNKKARPAHRFAYEVLIGSVPARLVLDHEVCSRPECVNPNHLVPKTINENGQRERGNLCRARLHELSGENLLVRKSKRWGQTRICRTCRNTKRNEARRIHGRAPYDVENQPSTKE